MTTMAAPQVHLTVKVAWWLSPYLKALGFFCAMMNREPDWEKVDKITRRAIRVQGTVK